jgi:hypothetical protein
MTTPPPPQGLFGLPDISDLTKLLPPQVGNAIKNVVGKILDPDDHSLDIGDPQPPGTPPIPVEAGSEELSTAVKAIDAVTHAIDLVLTFSALLPDQYEAPLRALRGALKTVRGWLD